MSDDTLSQALKEAYASAPAGQVVYHTLEFNHSAFTSPIRVVRGFADLTATLEGAGGTVTFIGFNFDMKRPEVITSGLPQITIEIDNVDRAIVANVELALQSTEQVRVTYREFLSTDLSAPQNNPPITLTVSSISATLFRVTAVAGFPNLMNKRFPNIEYSAEVFPSLL